MPAYEEGWSYQFKDSPELHAAFRGHKNWRGGLVTITMKEGEAKRSHETKSRELGPAQVRLQGMRIMSTVKPELK